MRSYYVPELWEEYEEKVIGGMATLRQFIYILGAIGLGGLVGSALPGPLPLRVVPVILLLIVAVFLGYFEVPDAGVTADRYLLLLWRFRRTRKEYPYMRVRAAGRTGGETVRLKPAVGTSSSSRRNPPAGRERNSRKLFGNQFPLYKAK